MRFSRALLLLVLILSAPAVYAQATFGALNNTNNAGDGYLNGLAAVAGGGVLPSSGTLNSVHAYLHSETGGGNWRIAIYQGGASATDPNGATLVWDSGLRNDNFTTTPGWQTFTASGSLTASRVWVAMKSELSQHFYLCSGADCGNNTTAWYYYTSSAGMSPNSASTAFPGTVSAIPDGSSGPGVKFYITYTPAAPAVLVNPLGKGKGGTAAFPLNF